MAKLSAATRNALSILAHAEMARGIEKNVEGAKGFYDFWLKQQRVSDRAILKEFEKIAREAYVEMLRMMQEEEKP